MRGSILVILGFLVSGFLVGGLSAQSFRGGDVQQASSSYVIQPLDYVVFRIIGEPDTDKQVRVSSDGKVDLPYIRSVEIAGLTVADAQQLIFELYEGDYYIDPQVDLAIMANSDKLVQVIGYVVRPGPITIPAEKPLYLMEAISAASGFQQLGDTKRVEIRRSDASGEQKVIEVNTEGITSRDYELKDGDIINVPRRIW